MLRTLVHVTFAFLVTAPLAVAAQTAPAMPAAAPAVSPALVTACVQAQQQAMTGADGANRRLELARQTNQPASMRAAMDDLQVVLSSMRTQLAPCATLEAAAASTAGPMAGHDMSTMSTAGAAAPGSPVMQPGSPAAADPHAGMVMPGAQGRPAAAAARGVAPAGRPAAAPADPHAGMVMPAPSARASSTATLPAPATSTDSLKCPRTVDPKTALRVLHQGRMHYFCSEQDRAAFVKDPAKYRTAGEATQAAPPPAHGH